MQLSSTTFFDKTAKLAYKLKNKIDFKPGVIKIKGENGIGKTRFLEGVLLREAKNQGYNVLYFGQDLENQILTFNLISLVKGFIENLRAEGNFFKAILFNDDSHNDIEVKFDQKSTLTPDNNDKKDFILNETLKYKNVDIIAFDEVDKYFNSEAEFNDFISKLESKYIFIISHILKGSFNQLELTHGNKEILIEYSCI